MYLAFNNLKYSYFVEEVKPDVKQEPKLEANANSKNMKPPPEKKPRIAGTV